MKIIVVEDGVRSEVEIERPVISIGRAIDNDLRIASALISRRHCRIESDADGLWIIDLGSANGTLLNGARIKRSLLQPGDTLRVGKATLQIEPDAAQRGGDTQPIDGYQAAEAAAGEVGAQTLGGEALRERDNLRVFARITRELLRETDLGKLLRSIVDSAVSLAGAERGFLLLDEALGAVSDAAQPAAAQAPPERVPLNVRVARSFDKEDIPIPSSRLSSGIALKVLTSRQPLLSVDAERDERFEGMASVEDLRLRSVMCVPLCGNNERGRVEGVLYVDNRLQQSAFGVEDLELMKLLADQSLLAIRNARQLGELRERNEKLQSSARKIELLNEQLGRKVRDRDTELAVVRSELGRERGRYDYTAIVGASEGMRRVFHALDRIIESELPVLIQGESGTGKELIARAIHFNGPRKSKAFVSENCAALPDTLLESELFGHTRGAFTGAHRDKKGRFELADGGSIFLDEVGDLSLAMQVKLLRVLQEGTFEKVGAEKSSRVDVRVISATNKDLKREVAANRFREDLFYRLSVIPLTIPPLRERLADIPLLAAHILDEEARRSDRRHDPARPPRKVTLDRETLALFIAHRWPGNIRELQNVLRFALIKCKGTVLRPEHLPPSFALPGGNFTVKGRKPKITAAAAAKALEQAGGRPGEAAHSLGVSRATFYRHLPKERK